MCHLLLVLRLQLSTEALCLLQVVLCLKEKEDTIHYTSENMGVLFMITKPARHWCLLIVNLTANAKEVPVYTMCTQYGKEVPLYRYMLCAPSMYEYSEEAVTGQADINSTHIHAAHVDW